MQIKQYFRAVKQSMNSVVQYTKLRCCGLQYFYYNIFVCELKCSETYSAIWTISYIIFLYRKLSLVNVKYTCYCMSVIPICKGFVFNKHISVQYDIVQYFIGQYSKVLCCIISSYCRPTQNILKNICVVCETNNSITHKMMVSYIVILHNTENTENMQLSKSKIKVYCTFILPLIKKWS